MATAASYANDYLILVAPPVTQAHPVIDRCFGHRQVHHGINTTNTGLPHLGQTLSQRCSTSTPPCLLYHLHWATAGGLGAPNVNLHQPQVRAYKSPLSLSGSWPRIPPSTGKDSSKHRRLRPTAASALLHARSYACQHSRCLDIISCHFATI